MEGAAMFGNSAKQWMLSAASAAVLLSPTLAGAQTNINLAVASNFFGIPPGNSAITDIIIAFEAENPGNTVTVVDNGATATLEANIIAGNTRGVDLFLAADTETPQDLLINHFSLVTPYNNSLTPALYTFDYAQGVLALLSNTPNVDLSCATGTCGYDPTVFATVGIADPSLAPYGVASQSVLTGRYSLAPPLCQGNPPPPPPPAVNGLVRQPCYANITASLNAVLAREVPVGFVAMSAICSNGKFPTQGNGTSAFAYFAIESTNTTPPMIINNYNPLTQGGISVRNTPAVTPQNPSGRTPAQNAELQAFVEFLTDFTQPPTPDSPMMATLKKFCYSAP
jgi:ABC-type molybdate transport system substrate-binding protein